MKIAHKLCVFCANIAPSIALNVAPYPHKTASARVSAPNYPAPTMNPSRLRGAWSIMILNMSGSAMPVPAP